MAQGHFVRRVWLGFAAEEVFAWHERPGAFERLTPPWERVELVDRDGSGGEGDRVVLRVGIGPIRKRWVLERQDYQPGRQFCDEQVEGPFKAWRHEQRFVPESADRSYLEDCVDYTLPGGALGHLLGRWLVERRLARLFDYRHRVLVQDLKTHERRSKDGPMRILVTGSSGLVGSALVPFLETGGHTVLRLVRRKTTRGRQEVYWDPEGIVDTSGMDGLDAVVHLAGESIGEGRWTDEKRARIRSSRVDGTRLLSETLACLRNPPRVLICASAIGYYGNRGEEALTEESDAGTGFLAEVCQEWEAATEAASRNGIRVVNLRLGMVLSPGGGAFARMLLPFQLGLGGRLGDGKQYVSWVSLEDVIGAIYHALTSPDLSGPVNCVAPRAVTNTGFTRTLGRVLRRPTLFRVPAAVLRRVLGDMADELLLSSARAIPRALSESGYRFRHRELDIALKQTLGR